MSKFGRKYIEDNDWVPVGMSLEDEVMKDSWIRQREIYGFDERETWSLDATMIDLLFERLCMYLEIDFVNLELHRVEIDGEIQTQKYWIGHMLELIVFINEEVWEECRPETERLWRVWSKVSHLMWW